MVKEGSKKGQGNIKRGSRQGQSKVKERSRQGQDGCADVLDRISCFYAETHKFRFEDIYHQQDDRCQSSLKEG